MSQLLRPSTVWPAGPPETKPILLKVAAVAALTVLLLTAPSAMAQTGSPSSDRPIMFTQNSGQWIESVAFRADVEDATMWFMRNGIRYQFFREVGQEDLDARGPHRMSPFTTTEKPEHLVIDVLFVGSRKAIEVAGKRRLDYYCNYFLGNDQTRWRGNVPNYETILYPEIYPGIDLKYYGNGQNVEYDFMVSPGSDPSKIRLQYVGAKSVEVNSRGELEIETAWGLVTERPPYVYQPVGNDRRELASRYRLLSENSFCFELEGNYDRNLPLVIDPVLAYSTFFGGSGSDYGYDIALDADGNMYVAGFTFSTDFPMQDPLQAASEGDLDFFISKLSAAGDALIYSTYFGGSARDEMPNLALDNARNICVFGRTESSDFPVYNAYQPTKTGGFNELVVFKINNEGNAVIFSTYLGGTQDERPGGIALDGFGAIYLAGLTTSTDFPMANPYMGIYGGGDWDGFVTKMTSSGDALAYSTFLGGSERDELYTLAVSAAGEAYVAGCTYSHDFPVANALYGTINIDPGIIDATLTKFNSAGSALEFSTYLGGSDDEWINSVVLDGSGNVMMAGCTESEDLPLVNPVQSENHGGDWNEDMFVAVITETGDELVYSTYFGGSGNEFAYDIAVGPDGIPSIIGETYSPDFPLFSAADIDPVMDDNLDAYAVKIPVDGSAPIYSSYLGGSQIEMARAVAVDAAGNSYFLGKYTESANFPTVDPFQPFKLSNRDAFISKIEGGCCARTRGNFDGDVADVVDVADIIYAVNWTFASGEAPPCLLESDVDGNGSVDIEDLVYLVNYVYGEGYPAPVDCP